MDVKERIAIAEKSMEEIRVDLETMVDKWNEKSNEEKPDFKELSSLVEEMKKACQTYAKHARSHCFDTAIETGGNIFVNLVKAKTYRVIGVHDSKDSVTGEVTKETTFKEVHIDPEEFEKHTGRTLGTKGWKSAVAELGFKLCLMVANDLGGKTEVEKVLSKYDLSKRDEQFRNGATPWSGKQLENALNNIIKLTIGEQEGYKVKKPDVVWVREASTKVGKETRQIELAKPSTIRSRIVMDYLQNVIYSVEDASKAGYTVKFKEKKQK